MTDRSAAARRGWITRRRNAARAAGAPILSGFPATYHHPGQHPIDLSCGTCGRNLFAEALKDLVAAPNNFLARVLDAR